MFATSAYTSSSMGWQLTGSTSGNLYMEARSQARARQFWSKLTGRPNHLANSEEILAGREVRSSHYLGLQLVEIHKVVGSEGRNKDFDRSFYPLNGHTQARWQSIARAYHRNIPLPPVELIKIGEAYIVRDGHHRISVARRIGQKYVDAKVVEWEVE
jgi:hypothetical protein